MAVNLRLDQGAEAALRAESQRTGRSQQEILREAVDQRLGRVPAQEATSVDSLVADGKVLPPRVPYRDVAPRWRLSPGEDSLELLDREDRV